MNLEQHMKKITRVLLPLLLITLCSAVLLVGCNDLNDNSGNHNDGTIQSPNGNKPTDNTPVCEHIAGDWIIDTQPTCSKAGIKHKECSACDVVLETATIEVIAHTPMIDTAIEPTCTQTGLTEGTHCSVCNTIIVKQEMVMMESHTASNWITDKEATYSFTGSKHQECSVCHTPLRTEIIPKLQPIIAANDTTPPQMVSFVADKTEVAVGDTITFTAELVDDSTIYLAEYQFKLGADYHNIFLEHQGGNVYSAQLKITTDFVNGTYKISWIALTDYAGNDASNVSSAVTFTVNNPNSSITIAPNDNADPILLSFSADKAEANVGDTIHFTAKIQDDSSINYAEFQFKLGADYHNVFLEHQDGNVYVGSLKITENFIHGIYKISWISIEDYANNTASPTSNVSFMVVNPNSSITIAPNDKDTPELISFVANKTTVKAGDTITFTAEINDASTIDYAQFQFKLGADYHNVFLEKQSGNVYVGSLRITDSFLEGEYTISLIAIQDYANNSAYPSSDVAFTVVVD